jgi:hypothetical protein
MRYKNILKVQSWYKEIEQEIESLDALRLNIIDLSVTIRHGECAGQILDDCIRQLKDKIDLLCKDRNERIGL